MCEHIYVVLWVFMSFVVFYLVHSYLGAQLSTFNFTINELFPFFILKTYLFIERHN